MRKKLLLFVSALILVVVASAVIVEKGNEPNDEKSQSKTQSKQVSDNFNKKKYSIDDPDSIWVIVNKKRPLPDGYAPNDLVGSVRREPAEKLQKLLAAAKSSGFNLYIISGFRSQQTQANTYNAYVAKDGQARADKYSARPRHSEHQTGLAVDLGSGTCDLDVCFGETPAGKWLATHAHEYGFILRYQKGKESLDGYQYEPWHLRYVGVELAHELAGSGQTMEQFFDLQPATSY